MLVKFVSSETGEMMMFSDIARQLLSAIGKECSAYGTFTVGEMLPAAQALRAAVKRGQAPADQEDDEAGEDEKPVALGPRAWPLIEMLERTARGGEKAHIIWEAPKDF